MSMHWSVAQIFSKRAHWIESEIRKCNRDVYQPSYERQWISGGKLSSKPSALMPGYLFFMDNGSPLKDTAGSDIEGVIRVLSGNVRQDEYERMRWACDLGKHDETLPEIGNSEPKRRHRRSRRSKRAKRRPGSMVRAKMRAERECA